MRRRPAAPGIFTSGPGATRHHRPAAGVPRVLRLDDRLDDPRHARLRRIVSRGFTPQPARPRSTDDVQRTPRRSSTTDRARASATPSTAISARLPLTDRLRHDGRAGRASTSSCTSGPTSSSVRRPGVRAGRGRHPDGAADGRRRARRADARAGPRTAAEADRRRHVGAGQRGDRRRAADPRRAGELLHPARRGRQRDHPQRHQLGPAAAHRAPRPARRSGWPTSTGSRRPRSRRSSAGPRR